MTTIAAAELHHMLDQVLPHMSTDDTLPVINAVHIEARDGYLFAVTTDRYTLAVARTALPDDAGMANVAVPAENIPTLNEWLESSIGSITVSAEVEDDEASVTFTSKASSLRFTFSKGNYRGFPNWRNLMRGQLDRKPQPVPLTGFTTKYLARWKKAASVLQCWQNEPRGAFFFADEMGGFLGMQMPVHHEITRDDLLVKWRGCLARHFTDVTGERYSLDVQWADADGDPWEYSGKDDHAGRPLMRLVGLDEDLHPFTELLDKFGPLKQAAA